MAFLKTSPKLLSWTIYFHKKSYWMSVGLKVSFIVNIIPSFRLGYGIPIGQNLAWGNDTWDEAIQGWFNEHVNFRYGLVTLSGKSVKHYTQVIFFFFFLNIFGGHIHMSYFGATDTPVLDFW